MTSPLQKATLNSYRLDMALYEPITTSIACSFNCICAFKKEQKALDKTIDATVAGLNPTEYQILKSIPGIGPVYAAGILAEIGSVRCFNSNNALAKYSGIIWRDNQSGEFDSEDTPMMKAGNRYLRYYLIQAAGSVMMSGVSSLRNNSGKRRSKQTDKPTFQRPSHVSILTDLTSLPAWVISSSR